MEAAAAPSAAAARSLVTKRRDDQTFIGSLQDAVEWDWRMTLFSAYAVSGHVVVMWHCMKFSTVCMQSTVAVWIVDCVH